MRAGLLAYFAAEKRGAWLLVIVGSAALLWTPFLVRVGATNRGAAWPIGLLGLLEIAIGAALLIRTDRQVATLLELLDQSPAALAGAEEPRMNRVLRTFRIAITSEVVILLAAMAIALLGADQAVRYGVALGCSAQVSFLLAFDLVAQRRAQVYAAHLARAEEPQPA